jgi:hypothetical protein
MATQLDLTHRYSNFYKVAEISDFDNLEGDLSQLGIRRDQFIAPHRLIFTAGNIKIRTITPTLANNFARYLGVATNFKTPQNLFVRFNSTPCANMNLHQDHINVLKESLRPMEDPTDQQIESHEAYKKFVTDIETKARNAVINISATLNNAALTVPIVRNVLLNLKLAKETEEETQGAIQITSVQPGDLFNLNYTSLIQLVASIGTIAKEIPNELDILRTYRVIEEKRGIDALHSTSLGYKIITRISGMLKTSVYHLPKPIEQLINIKDPEYRPLFQPDIFFVPDNQDKEFNWDLALRSEPLKIEEKNGFKLCDFCIFATSLKQSDEPNEDNKFIFAFQRMLQFRHKFFIDNDEKVTPTLEDDKPYDIVVPDMHFLSFLRAIQKPELFYADIAISIISYLRSGHHASAGNLPRIAQKIYSALGFVLDLEAIRNRLRLSVYHGVHVGSIRMQLAYWRNRTIINPLSNAISYRLVTDPPTFMAICNLERFTDTLASIGFFRMLESSMPVTYADFKEAMRHIHRVKHYACPYSLYLYGKYIEPPNEEINTVKKLAPYAAAIANVLPNSTLLSSLSLNKMSEMASVNALGATLQVDAFVTAFRQYGRRMVEQQMAIEGMIPRITNG